MNFKNLSENLIIVIVSVSIGGYVGYSASIKANKQTIQLLTPSLIEGIRKETTNIKNEITHDISVEIDKIKKSDSLNINLIQKPNTKQEPINEVTPTVKKLTRRQKRRQRRGLSIL